MPRRVKLDQRYIARIKKESEAVVAEVTGLAVKKGECRFCKARTIDQYEDLTGHYSAFCNKCGQVGIYRANCRHYSYVTVLLPYSTMQTARATI